MSNEPYVLITADTHAGGSHAHYREYLEPKYRDEFDAWRGGYKNPAQEHYGSKKLRNWDLDDPHEAIRTARAWSAKWCFRTRCRRSFARASSLRNHRDRNTTRKHWPASARTTDG